MFSNVFTPSIHGAVDPLKSSTHLGMKNSAGLVGCWIIEVNVYGKKITVGAREPQLV